MNSQSNVNSAKDAETETTTTAQEGAETTKQSAEETLKEELKAQQNKYLYLYADFENYKKRVIKERSDLLKFGHEGFVRELLLVCDNLERALDHSQNGNTSGNSQLIRRLS